VKVIKGTENLPKITETSVDIIGGCYCLPVHISKVIAEVSHSGQGKRTQIFKVVSNLFSTARVGDTNKIYKVVAKVGYHSASFNKGVGIFTKDMINQGKRVAYYSGGFTN
jgi:nucleosome binding factor SPN SPT16 subunit